MRHALFVAGATAALLCVSIGNSLAQSAPQKKSPKDSRDRSTMFWLKAGEGIRSYSINQLPSDCANIGDVDGMLAVKGKAGSALELQIKCGSAIVARCTATAPGAPMASRCRIAKTAATTGKMTCPVVPVPGTPPAVLIGASCGDP
jgi:hypothetical protein